MNTGLHFKILQRQLKFRNPNNWLDLPEHFVFHRDEYLSALDYLESLNKHGIQWTFPGDINYPKQFLRMKEPPLFFEFIGVPFWKDMSCLAVVGARKIHQLTENWMLYHLSDYLEKQPVCIVSGGAFGVDQLAHKISLKKSVPTIAIVPSGLVDIYPQSLKKELNAMNAELVCYLSEFEIHHKLNKSHFYFRNRLISALGDMVLVIQADTKSGSFLTVHHALENGKPVLTLPAHPELLGFSGNIKLLQDGAALISSSLDLLQIWKAENSAQQLFLMGGP